MQPRERIPKADHAALRAEFVRILNERFASSQRHLDWLNDVLSNSPTLTMRLEALLDSQREVLADLFSDEKTAVANARYYRNRFSHALSLDPLPAAKTEYIYWLTEQLTLLLCSCFTDWMGIPIDDRKALFARSRWLAKVRESAARLTPLNVL